MLTNLWWKSPEFDEYAGIHSVYTGVPVIPIILTLIRFSGDAFEMQSGKPKKEDNTKIVEADFSN